MYQQYIGNTQVLITERCLPTSSSNAAEMRAILPCERHRRCRTHYCCPTAMVRATD